MESDYDQKAVDVIKNLAMLVRRLCHRLNKHEPDSKIIDQALGYLRGEGLEGSALRDDDDLIPGDQYVAPRPNVQYWLAELDQYGNPKLIDGAHSALQGANQAAYLIEAMRLGEPNRRFAVARVELSECTPSAAGINLEAVRTINNIKYLFKRGR
jgi:hypothetical protein